MIDKSSFYYHIQHIDVLNSLGLCETATIIYGTCDLFKYIKTHYAKVIADDIINVQPMTGSTGEIFTLRTK